MTDEQMDARLRAAGEAWRAADRDHPAVAPAPQAIPVRAASRHRSPRTALLASAAVLVAVLVAGTLFVLAGRGDDSTTTGRPSARVAGTVWRLLGYGHRQYAGSTATFVVGNDGAWVADDECQVQSGVLDVRDGHLFPTRFASTRDRGCADATGPTFGDRFAELLTSFPAFSVDGNQLTITGSATTAYLQAAPALPAPTADVPAVEGATWQLATVQDAAGKSHPIRGTATFRIADHMLAASDTCNSVSGEVQLDGGRLVAGKGGGLAMTEMGCPPAVMATAAVVDAVLTQGPTVSVAGATLTISRPGSGTLTYRWVPDDRQATDRRNLVGRTWHLASLTGGAPAADATLRIDPDGTVRLQDGCRATTGTAEVGAGTLTTTGLPHGPGPSCAKAAADQATTIDSFLAQKPALWSIRNGKLLVFGGGAQAFSLVLTPDVPVPTPRPTAATIAGSTWKLTSVEVDNGNSGSGTAASDMGVTLSVVGSRYTLTTRCGSSAGGADVARETVTFRPDQPAGGSCSDDASRRARQVVSGTAHWSLRDGQLTLQKGATTLTFDR